MGEAPAYATNALAEETLHEVDFKSKGCQTTVYVGEKIYVIGGTDTATSTFGVRILNKYRNEWVVPRILGMNPKPSESHSAVLLNEDRILVMRGDTSSDDWFWFLEIDTPFIREQKKKLGGEVIAWSKGALGDVGKPIVITGPSGVGKGTLISKLMKEFPTMFGFSVSHTTRAPREKEQDGIHYHFIERGVMEKEIEGGKFLEFASVHGNLYGTSIEAVEVVADAGKRCILDIDVQGARSVRASTLDAIFIFICPPSPEELEKRLRARGTETEEQIQKRLRNARAELEQGQAPGLFDHMLINDDLEQCYANLKKLLGLNEDGKSSIPRALAESVELTMDRLVSKIDQKILVKCSVIKQGKSSEKMLFLDLSSLEGGAPGCSRGIYAYFTNPSEDGANGMNGVNKIS